MTLPGFVSTVRGSSRPARSVSVDAWRGLAIVCMVIDHLVIVTAGPEVLRLTVGRLAAPVFFLVSGHLVRCLSWRHYAILSAGLLLPVLVPWIDAPNVLVVYVLGAAALVLCRRWGVPAWLLALVALGFAANGWRIAGPQSFDVLALVGIMALGATLPRSVFGPEVRTVRVERPYALQAWPVLAAVGRRPLTWYLGHLVVLQAAVVLLGGSS